MKWVVGRGSLKSGVAGFCWSSARSQRGGDGVDFSRLLRLVMVVEIGVGHGEVDSDGFCYRSLTTTALQVVDLTAADLTCRQLATGLAPHRFEFLGCGLIS
ncbi:hypothetical protein CMV_015577 [Castanea mollissima]|uniref:Uncharacterized protein n=1 Tax=Castanea mollissima TaxID=60419 RepID=A0A8J4R9X0_9ROSI|nr:hypothetical protein CMV_015577 [Castanea mollissima]